MYVPNETPQVAALGLREYAKDNFNLFDGFIVISGLLELILSPPDILTGETGNTSGGALSALRSFRLFRVFKLARWVAAIRVSRRSGMRGRGEGGNKRGAGGATKLFGIQLE